MISVKRDFERRVDEIELYFSFMENITEKGGNLVYPDKSVTPLTSDIHRILKANTFLLLYNLSESCITNAIEEIYTTLHYERVSYDTLNEGVKKEIIKFLKNNISHSDFASEVNHIAYDIINQCFDKEKVFSGNVDAKEVRKIARKYGFSTVVMPVDLNGQLTHVNSDHLLKVKNQRNDLAHGIYSFEDCGGGVATSDLITIKNHVIAYLRQILNNIEKYIANKEYLLN